MKLALILALLAAPQGKEAESCPYCKNDPKLLAAAGLVSHGPIPLGLRGSEDIERSLPGPRRWIFLESAHLRWGTNLGGTVVEQRDRKRVEAELERLRKLLPTAPPKANKLDPFLRLHLMAMKGEEFYEKFQKMLGVGDESFADGREPGQPYTGIGRYLGEKDKYEILLHADRRTHQQFTKEQMGVLVTDALRWHYQEHHKLIASVPAADGDLREDRGLFPHIVHNLSHLFLAGYKHFSYDPPVWIDEGLSHAMEREINPEACTFDGDEGATTDHELSSDWEGLARKIQGSNRASSLAELWRMKSFGQLTREDHVICWSKVRFLLDEKPAEFARLLGGIKGQLDERGIPTGRDLTGLQRKLFKELLGWTPEEFDSAWRAWAAAKR